MPRRVPITCVVGQPIRVEKVESPSSVEVEVFIGGGDVVLFAVPIFLLLVLWQALHKEYFDQLLELFEKHKDICGYGDQKLVYI